MVYECPTMESWVHWVGLSETDAPFATYAYDKDLNKIVKWHKGASHYGEDGEGTPAAIAAGYHQNSYVVGNVPAEDNLVRMLSYSSDGNLLYAEDYDAGVSGSGTAVAVYRQQYGCEWCVVVGSRTNENTGEDVLVMRRDMEVLVNWTPVASVPVGARLKNVKDGGCLAADGSPDVSTQARLWHKGR